MTKRSTLLVIFAFIALITLPYAGAMILSRPDVFGGFLLNPIDGNSYLAKMMQGAQGEWRFHLPYTANSGDGAYLFLFYILLGHITRLLHTDVIIVFHAARLIGAILLALTVRQTVRAVWPSSPAAQSNAFVLALFGSGLGWMAIPFGKMTSDMWVAEAYPFLSSFANPHFPLGLAAILWIFGQAREEYSFCRWGKIFIIGSAAAVVMPFSPVVAGVVLAAATGWRWLRCRRLEIWPLTAMIGAALIVLAQFAAIRSDPVLAAWDVQNLTPAPGLFDIVISMSPAMILALLTIFKIRGNDINEAQRQMMIWFIAGWILIYLPFNLQRRFITGFFIPIAVLAGWALSEIFRSSRCKNGWAGLILAVSFITNIIVLTSGMVGAAGKASQIVIHREEMAAYHWLATNEPGDQIVLAAERNGLRIPAYSDQKVLYGHPFETVDAETKRMEITSFFRNTLSVDRQREYLTRNGVDLIFYGPEERLLGYPAILSEFTKVYSNEQVTIYSTRPAP